jgi:rubrerythrin
MSRKGTSQKDLNERLVSTLKTWQKIEDKSIESIETLKQEIQNPLVKQVFEIIQNDSTQHKRVQQFMIDSLEKQAISLTPEELGAIGTAIENHLKLERETIKLGAEAKETSSNFVHKYFLNYLLTDERKHDDLLDQLDNIRSKIYPYA